MYIEQGYRGRLGYWKYLFWPLGFIGLNVLSYLLLLNLPVSMEELLQEQIESKGSNRAFVELILPFAFMLGGLFIWTVLVHPQSLRSLTTSRKRVDWGRIGFAFLAWGLLSGTLLVIPIFLSPDEYVWNFQPEKFAGLLVIAILLVPFQTSFEEYLFRGHMLQGIGLVTRSRFAALLITSVIFGLMHLANPEVDKIGYGIMFFYIGTGLFLGVITLLDEGLELALGFHAANNIVGALLVTADWTAFQTNSVWKSTAEPTLGFDLLIPLLVVYPLLIFIFSRKYGWKNHGARIFGKVASKDEFLEWEQREQLR